MLILAKAKEKKVNLKAITLIHIPELIKIQQEFFKTEKTKDVNFRKKVLKSLLQTLERKEDKITEALYKDFRKPKFESVTTEIFFIIKELKYTLKNLNKWSRPEQITSSSFNFPSRDYIYQQPYGMVLLISPFNYPFHLTLLPLIGAIAAGNTVVIKPSEHVPNSVQVLEEIVKSVFNRGHVSLVEGGKEVSKELLYYKWDYVFFTGSVLAGRQIARTIAEHLTPCTLELGGKNPTIVDETAKIKQAARRIVFGKFINAGQTCIAPDYVLVNEKVSREFLSFLKFEITRFYGQNPELSKDFGRIINDYHFERLLALIDPKKVVAGGESEREELYISPTIILNPSLHSEIMQEEIFGPILPVLVYQDENDIDLILKKHPNPLAIYIFTKRKKFVKKIVSKYSFGGGTINDTMVHLVNNKLPFSGVGNSGMGAYHGKFTFDTFSHKKSVTKRGTWLDIKLRYAPYKGKVKWIQFITKYF